jgi:hypothetical protein
MANDPATINKESTNANDVAGVQKAEQIFSTGLPLRQQARDRALTLLPPSKP